MVTGRRRPAFALAIALAGASAAVGCGSGSGSSSRKATTNQEAAAAATGDIPDNQVFLTYANARQGYSLRYPEGWTQSGSGRDLTFADKGNRVHLTVRAGSAPGKTQKTSFTRRGTPDPVTGKRPLLLIDRYVYAGHGKVATLELASPKGVDNVDAYKLISRSFAWR